MNAPSSPVLPRTDGQRFLALWFPRLASDRIWRQRLGRSWTTHLLPDTPPLAVWCREDNTQRLCALDGRAEQLALRPGMGAAEARALYPALDLVEADPEGDARLLETLADWADRYTPLVVLDGRAGLCLDITGCSHLFGGEAALMAQAREQLAGQGFAVRAGLASTPGAAHAMARFADSSIVAGGMEADALAPLPLMALRLDPDLRHGLESVGLRTVGAVMATPRAPLARRFGREVLLRVDQALGAVEEAISPRRPVPDLSAERRFFDPVGLIEDIEHVAALLAARLVPVLEERGEGALALELALFRVDGVVSRLRVRAARPLRDPSLVRLLVHETLARDGIDPGFGFDLIRLSVLAARSMEAVQTDLVAQGHNGADRIALLADRAAARLGHPVILQPVPVASHVPERAVAYRPGPVEHSRSPSEAPARIALPPTRPLRLLRHPEPVDVTAGVPDGAPASFRWRRVQHKVLRAEGPERIAPEWWHDPEGLTRDYFRVEDAQGHRYWLFREGLYGGEPRLETLRHEREAEAREKAARERSEGADDAPAAMPEDPVATQAGTDIAHPVEPEPELGAEAEAYVRPPRWFVHGIFA